MASPTMSMPSTRRPPEMAKPEMSTPDARGGPTPVMSTPSAYQGTPVMSTPTTVNQPGGQTPAMSTPMAVNQPGGGGGAPPGGGGGDVSLQATRDEQLEALRKKQEGYTQQLETNTTTAANVGRLGQADALEAQKQAAKQQAMASGRPWTEADESSWNARARREMQQSENQMLLGREATIGASIQGQLPTIQTQLENLRGQQGTQLEAMRLDQASKQSQAALQAQQEYQQAMLKLEQERLKLQQSQQLSSLMYGPHGPQKSFPSGATNPIRPGAGAPGGDPRAYAPPPPPQAGPPRGGLGGSQVTTGREYESFGIGGGGFGSARR